MVLQGFCYFSQVANKRPYDQYLGQHDPQLDPQNPPEFVPRWSPNRSKTKQNTSQFFISILSWSFTDFYRFWPPNGPQFGVIFVAFLVTFSVLLALGAKMAPRPAPREPPGPILEPFWGSRWPQDPPKRAQEAPRGPQETFIFNDFASCFGFVGLLVWWFAALLVWWSLGYLTKEFKARWRIGRRQLDIYTYAHHSARAFL